MDVTTTRSQVPYNHDVNWDEQPLGKVSDRELARQLGCSAATVCRHRNDRGIPQYEGPKASKLPRSKRKSVAFTVRTTKFVESALNAEAEAEAKKSDKVVTGRTIASKILERWARKHYEPGPEDE